MFPYSPTRHTLTGVEPHRIAVGSPFYFFAIARRLYCGGTAVVLRRHGGDGGATAVIVRYHGGHGGDTAVMAVPRRSHCGLAKPAVALQFWTCSKLPPCHREGPRFWQFSAVLRRSMTEPLRNHGDHGGATAVYAVQAQRLRCDGTSNAEARRNMFKVAAVPPRRSAVLTVFRGSRTINDGTTAETRRSWRCHCGLCRTITAVAPRLECDGVITSSHDKHRWPVGNLRRAESWDWSNSFLVIIWVRHSMYTYYVWTLMCRPTYISMNHIRGS